MLLLLEAKHLVARETMQQYIRYVDIARHAFGSGGATLLFVLSVRGALLNMSCSYCSSRVFF